ncbi:unnamed protein product, partial [Meganyctiphanes norvegica]
VLQLQVVSRQAKDSPRMQYQLRQVTLVVVLAMVAWQGASVHAARLKRQSPECVAGKSWQQDCNSCFCTENGIAACTLKLCAPDLLPETGNSGNCPNIPDNLLCPADCAAQFFIDNNGCRACRCDSANTRPYCYPYCGRK